MNDNILSKLDNERVCYAGRNLIKLDFDYREVNGTLEMTFDRSHDIDEGKIRVNIYDVKEYKGYTVSILEVYVPSQKGELIRNTFAINGEAKEISDISFKNGVLTIRIPLKQ